jgi:hypothetical protein
LTGSGVSPIVFYKIWVTVWLFENLMSIRHGDLSQNCKTKIMRGDCANAG